MDVVIDTLAWSSTLVLPVALQVLEIADYVTKGIILLQIGRHILGKLSKDMREKPLLAGVGPAYYEASDDFGPRRSDPSPREQQISELSREFDADSNRVRAAVSAIEAIKRSTDIVAHSGGGVLSIPNRDDSIRIPGRIQARSS